MADTTAMRPLLYSLLAILLWFMGTHDARAQVPSAAQINAFRTLPADQQKAVLEAVGGGGADGALRRDAPLSMPSTLVSPPEVSKPAGPARIGRRSTIILDVSTIEETLGADASAVNARRTRIIAGNPYRLDEEGRIVLPTLPAIALNGLTDEQAAQLLNADPRLAGLRFRVSLLPIESIGLDALKRFGYDLFDQMPTTFAPATDIPVPADYRIGPGDNINIELFGKKTGRYLLVVDRTGVLTFPELGPLNVTSLTFDQVRAEIEQRVAAQMIGVRVSITMGQLRSIRIFVLGDVVRPGSYTISALSTITNALFASGGVTTVGTLRNVELKRGGRSIARFDLYDLLLRGDTSKDIALEQGDAIFVPPSGRTAGIGGKVRRPAIYEFHDGTTVGDLIDLSGGLMPDADPRRVRLERINASHERVVMSIDAASARDRASKLLPGDVLTVLKVSDETRGVMLEGHVNRPGPYAWHDGMRLTDLLGDMQSLKLNADQRYMLIRREHMPDRRIEVISADAQKAFDARGSAADPQLSSGDRVIVFSRQPDRGPALSDLVREMRLQARDGQPMPVAWVNGRVRAPGEYPLEAGMTVADLIRAGGGLEDAAYKGTAELTRHELVNNETRKTEVVEINLADIPTNGVTARTAVHAYDVLVIKETPDWRDQESVTLEGEVRFPGSYPIRKGETISSLVKRAGGLTDAAFLAGSVFTREEIRTQERQQLDLLANRLQSDLAFSRAKSADDDSDESVRAAQSLLTQLRNAKPTGRLVINLDRALANQNSADDLQLRGGDRLIVPRIKQYVTLVGEVQTPTSHVWKPGITRDTYIERSGGMTIAADVKRIYVVSADGSVTSSKPTRWFGDRDEIKPGDTIVVPVVPPSASSLKTLPVLQSVTTIMYNLAIAVAAVGAL